MAAEKKSLDSDSFAGKTGPEDFSVRGARDKLIVKLILETGMTPNELVHVRTEDIDAASLSLTIRVEHTKNKATRVIPLSSELAHALKRPRPGFVFSSGKSPMLRTRSVRKVLERYSKITGKKVTSVDLRRKHVRDSLAKGRALSDIKRSVGLKRLDRKQHLSDGDFRRLEAAAQGKERLLVSIPYETGASLKELVRIKASDARGAILSLGTRKVCLPTHLRELLHRFTSVATHDKYLFSSRQGGRISEKRAYQIITDISRRAGISLAGPRVLRNSCIARELSSGKDVRMVAEELGIRNVRFHLYGMMGGGND
ncbi:MAG: tyrosine-type recombinase/integrase [Nanoarchaeota archaeon]